MKLEFPFLITLQCFCLLLHSMTCDDSLDKPETPDGLLHAEELALAIPNNHKLGAEEQYEATKHMIPFDKNHFDFDSMDWSVFNVPQSKREQIIISVSPDISKELKISTIVRHMSDIILTYQIHMTAEEAPLKPTFSVFLITNGTRKLLIEESPQEKWKTTSLQIKTKKLEAQLLFVGVLRSHGNKIALRSFTFQDKSSISYLRYGHLPKTSESEDILTGSAGHGNTFFDERESVVAEKHPPHEDSRFSGTNSNGNDSSNNLFHLSLEDSEHETTIFPADIEYTTDNSAYNSNISESSDDALLVNTGSPDPSFLEDSTEYNKSITETSIEEKSVGNVTTNIVNITKPYSLENWTNYESSSASEGLEDSSDSHSVAGGVFNFFIAIIICATIVIAFLMWRRRRSQKDDEIPVFSRTSIEHGNPTFNDTESSAEAALQRDTHSNYKSFE